MLVGFFEKDPPEIPNNHMLMDGNAETSMFLRKDLVHHPTESTNKQWLFKVPGL